MKRKITAAALLSFIPLSLCASGASAQGVVASSRSYLVVARGHRIEVDHLGSFDPDCRSRGTTSVQLLSTPQGGEIGTRIEGRFPTFVRANIRSRCDAQRRPSTVVYYTARPDFTGIDVFDAEILYPAGVTRKVRYRVDVR